jgi:squalene synthase HpnC
MPDATSASLALARFRDATRACYRDEPRGALFLALADTIRRHDIPIEPFLDLIDAFEQDQRISRYPTRAALLDYCSRSANPVGRLVLHICGYRDQRRQSLSDLTCTALQLANFWQDVRRDLLALDRVYLPQDVMAQFGVSENQLRVGRADEQFRSMLRHLVDETEAMFDRGAALLPLLDSSVRGHIALFGKGGRAILEAIRASNFDTLSARPTLSSWQKSRLVASGIAARLRQVLSSTSATP